MKLLHFEPIIIIIIISNKLILHFLRIKDIIYSQHLE